VPDPIGGLHDQQSEEQLRQGIRWNEGKGKPLPRRYRTAATTLESYLQAAGGGLSYMVRLRRIEDELTKHERDLERVREGLTAAYAGEPERLAPAWRRVAEEWDFGTVNLLIERHNRWYPAESRLPMDPRTGDYALVRGESYLRRLLGPRWILDRI
jgi:hypothetical protein